MTQQPDANSLLILGRSPTLYQQLLNAGHHIMQASALEECLSCIHACPVRLILLIISAEWQECMTMLAQLRRNTALPLMVFSPVNAEGLCIRAFEAGADDFVSATTSTPELLLRIAALARRGLPMASTLETDPRQLLERAGIRLERRNHAAHYDGQTLVFTTTQFRLFWLLLANYNKTVPRDLLYQAVLEKPCSPFDRSLDMHMSRIRKKVQSVGIQGTRLVTVRGFGYRFE